MKSSLIFAWALALAAPLNALGAEAKADEEQKLIGVLQSNAAPGEQDAACARLKFIGSARSVPALAILLRNEQLSHSARYALESMRLDGAETALLAALDDTHGLTRIGIINSLGARGEERAVPSLSLLARGTDVPTAFAAVRAIGLIGGSEAVKTLQFIAGRSTAPIHLAAVDGLLSCANRLLTSGKAAKAWPLFEKIHRAPEPEPVRVAAFRGVLVSLGDGGLGRMITAIEGEPGPDQAAALQLVREIQARDATKAIGRLLPKVKMPVQLALVESLAQRGDPAAARDLVALANTAGPEVRTAIINALGSLGDATTVPVLAGFAASGTPAEQAAARQSLTDLRRGNVTEALLNQLPGEAPAVQSELARALGNRGDRAAVPKLLELAQHTNDSVRVSALKALGELVRADDLASLVGLVISAKDPSVRAETAEALNSGYQRLSTGHRPVPAGPLIAGVTAGSSEVRVALLPICSGLDSPQVRAALRTASTDLDSQVRTAALRALCDTVDPELLDDVVNLARGTKDENLRSLAIAGGVRVATQDEGAKISPERQVTVLRALLEAASNPAQKRMVLAGLAEAPTLDSLKLVDPLVDDAEVRTEAARAAIKIGTVLPSMQAQDALAVLNKALAAASDDQTRQALEAAINKIQASADYITDWRVAGPYRQAGKDYAALFDVVFPAEMGEGQGVEWKPLPAGADPSRPWVMDLLKTLGGEQCVAYARTWVHTDQDQPARLELGSDDGIKVWLNDKQVYALNTARALTPGSDKVDVTLHSGWNRLLLKVTQNSLGWEFCARFVKPDGTHLEGLQCGSTGGTEAAR